MQDILDLFHRVYDLPALIKWAGYLGLTAIIFSETGLLAGFFLPGDSLLVTAGLFSAQGYLNVVKLGLLLNTAAVVGNSTGYLIGKTTGPRIFRKEDSLLFNKKHLIRSHDFYEKHGGKTIILAQFMPIIRTFAPLIAGVAGMEFKTFFVYNVAGSILWVWGMLLTGYFLATYVPGVVDHIEIVIVLVIFVSILPGIISWLRNRNRVDAAGSQSA
jgi:membrane-associated protein